MKHILVVCHTSRDRRELNKNKYKNDYKINFHSYTEDEYEENHLVNNKYSNDFSLFDPLKLIEEIVESKKTSLIDGLVYSGDYPASVVGSAIMNELGLYGPKVSSVLLCQHKYYSRLYQKQFVPEATPEFELVDPKKENIRKLQFPFFIKPVKSYFSINANFVYNENDFSFSLKHGLPSEPFLYVLNTLIKKYTDFEYLSDYLLAEELLKGIQVTLEGFSYNGEVEILGIVDSIMYPGTISFQYFEYPSQLPKDVQNRMFNIAKKFIKGINLDNTLFNIEFMYNPETDDIKIIEVNPRMASQFADLYEKVDGINSYEVLLSLSTGNKPVIKKNEGKFKIAASFALRFFRDKFVLRLPDEQDIQRIYDTYTDVNIEICCSQGKKLSQAFQDGKSYRYALINLAAMNKEELLQKVEECKQRLPFIFIEI